MRKRFVGTGICLSLLCAVMLVGCGESEAEVNTEIEADTGIDLSESAMAFVNEAAGDGSTNAEGDFLEQNGFTVSNQDEDFDAVILEYNLDPDTREITEAKDINMNCTVAMYEEEDEEEPDKKIVTFAVSYDIENWDYNYFISDFSFMDRYTGITVNLGGRFEEELPVTIKTKDGDIDALMYASRKLDEEEGVSSFVYLIQVPKDYNDLVVFTLHSHYEVGMVPGGEIIPNSYLPDSESYKYTLEHGYTPMFFSVNNQ